MNITENHLAIFRNLINTYQKETVFPKKDQWKQMDNNQLWLWLVGQVMVVGGVAGHDRFQESEDLKAKLNYSSLMQLDDTTLKIRLNEVLCKAGVRYASNDLLKCRKSSALVDNFKFVSSYEGGFEGLLNFLSKFQSKTAELDRVAFLTQNLKFIKNKSARDFLMSMGFNTNTLAIDIRIQNIFKHFALGFPPKLNLSSKAIYDDLEREIIDKICKPLEVQPVKFDRILFQNYKRIISQ